MRATLLVLTGFIISSVNCLAQTCTFSTAGLNSWRKVMGPVNLECGGFTIHSAPFGNWGANSNFGLRNDGTQFQPKKSSWNLIPPLASACRAPAEP
ncbi:MAG: hypothetical protein ACK6DZ_22270, partial [Acidobacteriota bacterium]|jgi:hypothetical protein